MTDRATSPPVVMSANVDGPLDPHDFYHNKYEDSTEDDTTSPLPRVLPRATGGGTDTTGAPQSYSLSPARYQPRSVSSPVGSPAKALGSVRSNPVLLPSRRQGSVKDIANRFDQGAAAAGSRPPQPSGRISQERSRRPTVRSPVGAAGARGDASMVKLQKRRPGGPKSPQKSPVTSFETNSSASSKNTISSTRSLPRAAFNPQQSKPPVNMAVPFGSTKPLFGELTADGWHGNFSLSKYGQLPVPERASSRRQSDGDISLAHGRSQSHQDMTRLVFSPPVRKPLHHQRSRSDMDAAMPHSVPSMPNLSSQNTPVFYPTPPQSGTRHTQRSSPTSRIPVHSRHQSLDSVSISEPNSRSASAMSETIARRKLQKSPTRTQAPAERENTTPISLPRSRYQPPPIATSHSNQMLSAKIVVPLPRTSPPLRSSRPRQPVSSATTSASRARAADRFQSPTAKDGRRPSEQWLGKPYDAQKERVRRKIPELQKVDFAERRARIQMAITQNLEDNRSKESLMSTSRRNTLENDAEVKSAVEDRKQHTVDQNQAAEMNEETDRMEEEKVELPNAHSRGLSLDTSNIPEPNEPEPATAATEFEVDESPVLGHQSVSEAANPKQELEKLGVEVPFLLSATTYQPLSTRARTPSPIEPVQEEPEESEEVEEHVQSPSVLENAMRMRDRSESSASRDGTDFADDSPSLDGSLGVEDSWGLGDGQGSIEIMLDNDPTVTQPVHEAKKDAEVAVIRVPDRLAEAAKRLQQYNDHAFAPNGFTESPTDESSGLADDATHVLPDDGGARDDTLKPSTYCATGTSSVASRESLEADADMARALDDYETTGAVRPEMLDYLQSHSVDLQHMSANGGSDAIMIQKLLDSMLDIQGPRGGKSTEPVAVPETLQPTLYELPTVTPDTPPDAVMSTGTAVVFSNPSSDADEDFQSKIRRADEEWERRQRGEDTVLGADDEDRPTPPPKDIGYTPRSSTGPISATFPPYLMDGLRISTTGDIGIPEIYSASESIESTPVNNDGVASPTLAPPQPAHAPPLPPSPLATKNLYGLTEMPQMSTTSSERGSNELSPRVRRNPWGPTGSPRPSIDSQRAPGLASLPGANSMSSFAGSTRHSSMDTGTDSQARLVKTTSPGPEQKRLMKRRHIIKELLDTENTYHQDLKIIEDIYKATVADLVTLEDRKTLFGNCDEIERFSLFFYDQLRKAVTSVYVPPKQMRWANKRESFSTMQSDATDATSVASSNVADEEKDRGTTVGQCFLNNLQQMDQVYGAYLKNHDAANQRLSALKNTPSVKCWLDECHNNASDITSAWDLDSLLVKPTQRVSKYPMLLQQLLETTPPSHPDHDALKAAAKESIGMLTRINEAKKRADIVDQIINRKGKESDMRTGIAKAFGRRTEKLKERVGIAEAFQDAEFDELSYKFGGHFIRLQICMRDVQDYLNRVDKAMEHISNTASALELYTDVSLSTLPEVESKWRKYCLAVREITAVAFPEHKAAVRKRVIDPMVACIDLHTGPQNAIHKRKRRIVDYAKCKAIEKRGEKPDKKTVMESEMYIALNDQLKIELPKLYSLTAGLVQGCLTCFLDIQLKWYNMWERKLRPILEAADIPSSIQQIEPTFRPDYELVKDKLIELGICNGATLAESANFLSPTSTLVGEPESGYSSRRPSAIDGSKRTMSIGSDTSPMPGLTKRYSGYTSNVDAPPLPREGRMRSVSSLSTRSPLALQTSVSSMPATRPWASSNGNTPTGSFSGSRPATAHAHSSQQLPYQPIRQNLDGSRSPRSPRPVSQQTYFTARPDPPNEHRLSAMFTSAYPPDMPESVRPTSSPRPAYDMTVMFVCASLFEFSIDNTRKEAGYPYLTYVQGEVFDVIAQKGELWLAKNQDDQNNSLGWIWEQHFVILSQDSS